VIGNGIRDLNIEGWVLDSYSDSGDSGHISTIKGLLDTFNVNKTTNISFPAKIFKDEKTY
jgi:hypothetical protein